MIGLLDRAKITSTWSSSHPGSPLCAMKMGAGVEDHVAAVWIGPCRPFAAHANSGVRGALSRIIRGVLSDVDRIAAKIAQLAGRQYGHVTREQLLAAGVSASGIQRWVRAGRLIRVHAGVYAVGHPRGEAVAVAAAAWLACGDGAVLSHQTATALWGFGSRWPVIPEITGVRGQGATRRRISARGSVGTDAAQAGSSARRGAAAVSCVSCRATASIPATS